MNFLNKVKDFLFNVIWNNLSYLIIAFKEYIKMKLLGFSFKDKKVILRKAFIFGMIWNIIKSIYNNYKGSGLEIICGNKTM